MYSQHACRHTPPNYLLARCSLTATVGWDCSVIVITIFLSVHVWVCVRGRERERKAASWGRSISLTERSQQCLVPINDFMCVCVCYTVANYWAVGNGWRIDGLMKEENRWVGESYFLDLAFLISPSLCLPCSPSLVSVWSGSWWCSYKIG